jgi:D-aminopeptidase
MTRRDLISGSASIAAASAAPKAGEASERPRARDIGLAPGVFPPGALNAITDVAGVRVGHVTLIEGDDVRTGVTAILPRSGNLFQQKVAGGVFVGNAFGKLAGSTQVRELGTIETPIVLTNTLNVGTGILGVVSWTLSQPGNENVVSVNAIVGETNDSGLNDIRGMYVTREHVIGAIERAEAGAVAEGSVGAGTGTICFGWKGGIGTSSRLIPKRFGGHTVGVLVQTNYGGILTMGGAPVGKELGKFNYGPDTGKGSCMIVVATDAPLSGRQCTRLAARAVYGLARTGSSFSNGSGDYGIAFSTNDAAPLHDDEISPLFEAALEATEEAVYNSLLKATTVASRRRTVEAIPVGAVRRILRKYHVV